MNYDLMLKGGQIIDVRAKRIFWGDILVKKGAIIKISNAADESAVKHVIDVSGNYIAPGFIDSHLHIESSMLSPLAFSQEAVRHGTTSLFVDPHEIANVAGRDGIRLFLEQSDLAPLDIFIGVPSCVPATDMEDSGASITMDDIKDLIHDSRIYGLGEMMNFPCIIKGNGDARERCDFVFNYGKIVDGHCPGVIDKDLDTYITNGKNDGIARITSDHQVLSFDEAVGKISRNMFVALRYGSVTKDIDKILPALVANNMDLSRFMLCSDDLNLFEFFKEGHIDRIIKRAYQIIKQNSDLDDEQAAISAISLGTINPASYYSKFFRFHNLPAIGEVAIGKKANLVVLSSLKDIEVEKAIYNGCLVVDNKKYLKQSIFYDYSGFSGRLKIGKPLTPDDFRIRYTGCETLLDVNVIEIVENSLLTKHQILPFTVINKELKADAEKDIAKIAVIERHNATGSFSLGFVKGLGIKKGVIASTISHDSHNLVVVGFDDDAMAKAAEFLTETGGGMAAITNGRISCFPLSIGGLMSTAGIEDAVRDFQIIMNAADKTGSHLDNIFMELAFLSLPLIPELRITNRGLVDVVKFKFVGLF